MNIYSALLGFSAGALSFLAISCASAQEGGDGPLILDSIVVEGERVDRSLRDTTSSVSVLTSNDLEREDGPSIYDAIGAAPNVTPTFPDELPNLRGANSSGGGGVLRANALNGTVPRAALIVDDVARLSAWPNNAFTGLYDIEQIEVFRGPQTTVRGDNAIAGAYVVKTRDPSDRLEGELHGGIDWNDVSDLGFQGAAVVNLPIADGELASRTVLQYRDGRAPTDFVDGAGAVLGSLSDFDDVSVRQKLLITPASLPGFSALLSGEYQEGRDVFSEATALDPVSARRNDAQFGIFWDTRDLAFSANLAQELGDTGELRSITSYVETRFSTTDDTQLFDFGPNRTWRFNQDLLYSFNDAFGFVDGVIGANYRKEETSFNGTFFFVDSGSDREDIGVFADLTLHLTDNVRLLAGGRFQRNIVEFDIAADAGLGLFTNAARLEENVFLPKLGLAVDLDANQTVSATVRRGFNSGGGAVNLISGTPFVFAPEFVWTFELGYRASFLADRLSLAATAFYNDHSDYQVLFAPGVSGDFIILNFDGESYGMEIEARYLASDSVTLGAGLGLLRTELTEAGTAVDGNRFGQDPDVTANASIAWEALPGFTLDARANYVGGYFTDFTETPGTGAGDYVLLDLGASYEYEGWRARAFVRNATDEIGFFTRFAGGAEITPPLTVGFTLTKRF